MALLIRSEGAHSANRVSGNGGPEEWEAPASLTTLRATKNHVNALLLARRVRALRRSQLFDLVVQEADSGPLLPGDRISATGDASEVDVALYFLAVTFGVDGAGGAWLEGSDRCKTGGMEMKEQDNC